MFGVGCVRVEVKDFTDGRYTKDIVSVFEGVVADFPELDGLMML